MAWLPIRGGRLQPRPPCKGAVGCGQAPYKGRPLAGTAGCGLPVRGCCPQTALPPARATTPAVGVAAPWQAYVFLVYCWAYVPVIICNYMERRSGSVKVTAGPTIPWREITMHGDATIRRN
ncbi:hypothetical protein GW17_00055363 [Ensete ventricosum]|nr:hypothetical protein GW17_00055363 [Ensete ventricosum]